MFLNTNHDHQQPMTKEAAQAISATGQPASENIRKNVCDEGRRIRVQDAQFHRMLDEMFNGKVSEDEIFETLSEAHEKGNLRPNVRDRFLEIVKDRSLAVDFPQ